MASLWLSVYGASSLWDIQKIQKSQIYMFFLGFTYFFLNLHVLILDLHIIFLDLHVFVLDLHVFVLDLHVFLKPWNDDSLDSLSFLGHKLASFFLNLHIFILNLHVFVLDLQVLLLAPWTNNLGFTYIFLNLQLFSQIYIFFS